MKRYKVLTVGVMAGIVMWSTLSVQAQEEIPYGYVQTQKGVMWMQEDGTWAVDCWLAVGERIYHMDKNGCIQVGMTNIDGKIYYLYPEGRFAQGWTQINGEWYFFNLDGTLACNTVIDGRQVGNDGKIIFEEEKIPTQENELHKVVDSILDVIITPDMTEEEKIFICYWHMVNVNTYKRSYEKPEGNWTGSYAFEIFTTGEGNCYHFASGFAYLLRGLGYETKVITGEVVASRGGTTPHGWTEVKIGDEWYVFDTELQYANKKKDYYWKTYATYPSKPLIKQQEWPVNF